MSLTSTGQVKINMGGHHGQQRQTQYQETQAGCRKETRKYKGRRKESHEVMDLVTATLLLI
jgi:hypothetical protein